MTTESKKWYASRTLWVNIVAFVATITGIFGLDLGLDSEAQATFVAAIMSIVNIILRFDTKTEITK